MKREELPTGLLSVIYAATEEMNFNAMAAECGYKRKTTFYADLSIAECFGLDKINETFESVCKEWVKNVECFTEFVMVLNWKSWAWHDRGDDALVELYSNLFVKAEQLAYDTFEGDDLSYFIRTTD